MQRACQVVNSAFLVRVRATRLGAAHNSRKFVSASKAPRHNHPHLRLELPGVVRTNCANELRIAGARTVQDGQHRARPWNVGAQCFSDATPSAQPRCALARLALHGSDRAAGCAAPSLHDAAGRRARRHALERARSASPAPRSRTRPALHFRKKLQRWAPSDVSPSILAGITAAPGRVNRHLRCGTVVALDA